MKSVKEHILPSVTKLVLKMLIPEHDYQFMIGYYEQGFDEIFHSKGSIKARFWLWKQMIKSSPGFIKTKIIWSSIMFKNYLKSAIRNIVRRKVNSFLNIFGLSLSIACSLLIIFHIKDEISYDRHFPKAYRIFRLTQENINENNQTHWALVSPVHGLEIKQYIPEIEDVVRVRVNEPMFFSYKPDNDKSRVYKIENTLFADRSFIDIFDLQFIAGDPETALNDVNSVIVSEVTAEKYFGVENPVGKMLDLLDDSTQVKVTGVVKEFPDNTHFQFDVILSMPSFYRMVESVGQGALVNNRGWAGIYTYVLLQQKDLIQQAEGKLTDFQLAFFEGAGTPEFILQRWNLHLQPITDIHLYSSIEQEINPNSSVTYIYIFAGIAMLLLIIAGVNFINIFTTQAMKRSKEIGIRKVLGAYKKQLFKQYIGESLILTIISGLGSLVLFIIFLPFYNNIAGKDISFIQFIEPVNFASFVMLIVVIGILSGVYPAIFISGFNPLKSLKGVNDPDSNVSSLRKSLVVFQFAISIFMIFSTIILYLQMDYFKNKNLGFDKDNIVCIDFAGESREFALKNTTAFKTELMKNNDVKGVTLVSNNPGERLSFEPLFFEGRNEDERAPEARFFRVDEDFISVLGIKLLKGSDFTERSSSAVSYIINESAAAKYNFPEYVGLSASDYFRNNGEIVGIIENFNFSSLHDAIDPLVLEFLPKDNPIRDLTIGGALVKIQGGRIPQTIEYLEEKYKEIAPNSLFVYSFLDDELNMLYNSEEKLSNLFKTFAFLAIAVSCLGLFGLASYSAELRIKEVGIRKVLGASTTNILGNLSKSYIIWISAANLIALPIGWFVMQKWLENFAFHIDIGPITFIIVITAAIVFALIPVGYQSLKAALTNPVDSLKYE